MNARKLLIGILSAGLMFGAAGASLALPHHSHGHVYWGDSERDHRAYRPHRRHHGPRYKHRHHHKHRHYHRPFPRYRTHGWYLPRYDDDHWGFTLFYRD